MSKQLIILGNGFDLASNLKSSYQDFFDWILRENGLTESEINKILNTLNSRTVKKLIGNENITSEKITSKISPLNTWFLLFLQGKLLKDSNWKDVEKQIEYYLNNKLLTPTSATGLSNGHYYINFTENINIDNVLNIKLFLKHQELLKEFPVSNFLDFFLSELYSLEADFEKFLFGNIGYEVGYDGRGLQGYFKSARELLEKLVSADSDKNLPYNIMSFNYTDPWDSRWEKNSGLNLIFSKPEKSTNVHGQALKIKDGVSRIIFGIDNQNIKPSDIRYLFTKTFRTLVNYSDDRKPLDSVKENVFDKDISIIKFFGHSLSEADYSYFQQMFDYYNLYSNDNLKLFFYFKKYDTREPYEYLHEQSKMIVRLIEKYGETMDNQNHGKNLLTRLEMTKRIFIKEI